MNTDTSEVTGCWNREGFGNY